MHRAVEAEADTAKDTVAGKKKGLVFVNLPVSSTSNLSQEFLRGTPHTEPSTELRRPRRTRQRSRSRERRRDGGRRRDGKRRGGRDGNMGNAGAWLILR